MSDDLVPVGVRLPRAVKHELHERARREGSTLGGQVRLAVELWLAPPRLRPLVGTTDAARLLGVASGNLAKLSGLPEPIYRLTAGCFYDTDEIEAFADVRRARKAA